MVVSNAAGSMTSNAAMLTVTAAAAGTDVVTYKYDVMRTGQNLAESALTPSNVTSATFGKLRNLMVDGLVDAQPLYLSKLTVAGATHNVVFVATEHDSVYAFDADTGTILWQVSLIGAGETTSDDRGCSQVTPEIGITSTPVIDRNAGAHGTIYVVAMTKDASSNYHQRLHALDITTGTGNGRQPDGDYGDVRSDDFCSRTIQGARRTAVEQRHDLHDLGVSLRFRPIRRLDHRCSASPRSRSRVFSTSRWVRAAAAMPVKDLRSG